MAHDFHCPVGVKPWEDDYCCQRCNPGETPPWERTCICDSSLGSSPVTHDPMCEWWQAQCEGYDCAPDPGEVCEHFYCLCELIAKVRADERMRHLPQYGSGSYSPGSTTINSLI